MIMAPPKLYHNMATSLEQCITALEYEGKPTYPSTLENGTLWCNATWDQFLCWPAIPANTSHTYPCPPLRGLLPENQVHKTCHSSGRWCGKEDDDFERSMGWTNYSVCMTKQVKNILKELGPDLIQKAQQIASDARKLEFVGLTLSFISLIIAIIIFSSFRRLRVFRNQIHQQLMLAILLNVVVRLMLYIDLSFSKDLGTWVQGSEIGYTINSTRIVCEFFYLLLEYLKTVAFAFMFIEGFYLHNSVVVKVFQDEEPILWRYLVLGWGIPVVHVTVWVTVMILRRSPPHLERCLGEYYMHKDFWIMDGIRLSELVINAVFILNIVRVLWLKVKETHTSGELGQIKKSVKACLMLIVLLGIPNIMQTIPFTPNRNNIVFFAVFTFCASFFYVFQGLMVAVLYCFTNREVINVIKSRWNRYRLRHTSADNLRRGSRAASTFYQGASEYEQAPSYDAQENNHCASDVAFNGDIPIKSPTVNVFDKKFLPNRGKSAVREEIMEDGHVAKKRKVGMTAPNVMVTSEPSGLMPYRPMNGNLGPPSGMITGQNGRMPSTPNWAMNPNRDSLPVNMMHGANPRPMGHIPQHLPMHSVSSNGQQSFRGCSPSKAHLPNGTSYPDNVAHFAPNSGVPSPYQSSNMMMMRPPGQPTMQPYMTNMQQNVVPNQRPPFNLHLTGMNGNQTLYNGSGMNVNGPGMNLNGLGMNLNGQGMNLNGPPMNVNGPQMNPGMNVNGPGMNVNVQGMNMNSAPGMNLNGPTMNVNGPNNVTLQQNQSQFNDLTSNGAHFQMNGDLNGANLMQNSNVVGGNQDPEKRKLIQQQLVLLLHAHKCQQRERSLPSNGYQNVCTLAHCQTMKNVLNHMLSCRDGLVCSIPHCASSRQIISHWKQCQHQACAVCLPLRQWNEKKQNPTNSSNGNQFLNESTNNGFIGDAHSANFPSAPISNVLSRPNSDQAALGLSENGYPLSNGSSESVFTPSSFSQTIPAEETSSVKEWQKTITSDLRNHLVSKLVKAIFPTPDPTAFQDRRLQDLINYARKVEREMFDSAENREEYYHLLAEKIYKIQKELSDKKQKRLEEAQQSKSNDPMDSAVQWQTMPGSLKDLDSTVPPNRVAPQEFSNNRSSIKNAVKQEVKIEESYPQSNGVYSNAAEPKTSSGSFTVKIEESRELTNVKKESEYTSETSTSSSVCDVKGAAKIFTVDELFSVLFPVWEKLFGSEESLFFRVPVDPEQLFIPDYFKIVKKPIDLSTIRKKLEDGHYTDPWQFCEDIWLMFDNAWLYNRKNSKVYKFCSKLSETFTDLIDPVMKSFGLCCGKKRSFTPLALVCYGQAMCSIPRDAPYYYYETKPQFGVAPDRYTYCKKCFDEMSGDSICLSDDPTSASNCIRKSEFNLFKNDTIEYEPFVTCVDCGRKWHQICALHLDSITPSGFVCELCIKGKNKRAENRFTAKRLPTCKLSNHLESRVNNYLRSKEPSTSVEVVIRVLASSDKEVEVKPLMKAKYCTPGGMPDKFPYRTKAIFAFEVIDGVEVCFFGLHVQEYGDKSLPPNSRRVYIAYLDSVHFFQPKEHRTAVYHELLLAYLEYCKALGYTKAHIWACPPSEGDDYIFHCHPLEQKIPKPKRLQEWYKKLLDQGIIERIVVDYKDIHRQAQDDNVQSVADLPYFEGDYWPNVIEESIKESDNDEALRRREAEAQQVVVENSHEDFEDEVDDFPPSKSKKPSKGQKKHKQKSKGTSSKKSKKSSGSYGNGIIDKVFIAMEKHKEVFFVVQLHSSHAAANLGPINDPDSLLSCELMESRDTFLSTARERHWEFSSLRRAKWSTLGLCYELHTQGQEKFLYNCDSCSSVNAQWHCTVCEDYDLCQNCFDKINHQHKMEPLKISHDSDGTSTTSDAQRASYAQAAQRALSHLAHACQCRNANCKIVVCNILRRFIAHNKDCKKKDACPSCKKLFTLCCQHAKQCQTINCPVVFCANIKQKFADQEAKKKKKQAMEMYRRINQMGKQMSSMSSTSAQNDPDTRSFCSPQQSSPAMSLSASPAYSSGPMSNSNYPPNAPQGAVLAAKEVERLAAKEVERLAAQRSGYPDYPPAGRMPLPGPSNVGMAPNRVAMWNESGMAVTAPPNFTVHPRMSEPYDSSSSMMHHVNVGAGMPQGPQSKFNLQQKVQTLMQALKMAKSEEDKQRIMHTLRSDPQLFQTFISLRQPSANNQREIMKPNGNGVNNHPTQSFMNNMPQVVDPSSMSGGNFYPPGYGQQSNPIMHGSAGSMNRVPPNYGNGGGTDFTHASPIQIASPSDGTGVYYQNPVGNYVPNQEFDYASNSQQMAPNVIGHRQLVNAQQQQNGSNVFGPDFYSIRR